jgi:hypothetical protein
MKHIIKVTREFSSVECDTKIYLRVDGCVINTFYDTDEGREQARKAYQHAIEQVKVKGEVNETLFKEEIETNG